MIWAILLICHLGQQSEKITRVHRGFDTKEHCVRYIRDYSRGLNGSCPLDQTALICRPLNKDGSIGVSPEDNDL